MVGGDGKSERGEIMRRWERVGMEVGRRGEWCVCECVKRDDMGGVNTDPLESSDWATCWYI